MIYLVRVTISPKSPDDPKLLFKNIVYKGVFVPKNKQTLKTKIEAQCTSYLLKNLKNDHPNMEFEFKNFKIDRYGSQFTIVEDKK